jgi:transposase-like protein
VAYRAITFDVARMRKSYTPNDRVGLCTAVKSGESVQSAARRLGITMTTAYTWLRKAAGEDTTVIAQPTFIELVAARASDAGLVVRVGAAEIDVRPGFDGALLRAVVDTLRGAA